MNIKRLAKESYKIEVILGPLALFTFFITGSLFQLLNLRTTLVFLVVSFLIVYIVEKLIENRNPLRGSIIFTGSGLLILLSVVVLLYVYFSIALPMGWITFSPF